ncbi:MAG: hypothetical protein K0S09_547 [Sphingobacteriaceae bacterium]|jgi:hypothetical protein|nr:hypothetical protein [Sphingobacteriaceae bacterium]
MKKTLLLLFLLSILHSVNAQIVRIDTVKPTFKYKPARKSGIRAEYLYSIGLKLLTVQQLPKFLKQVDATDFYSSSLTGLMLKVNDNQISYRLFADVYSKNHSFKNECVDCEIVDGKVTDYSVKIGFEKKITYSRLQPYFGSDIGFRSTRFTGDSKNAGAINFTAPYDVTNQKNGGVLTPFVGLKFKLNSEFTLSAETGVDLLYSYETQEKMYRDLARTRTFQKYNKWEFLIKPLNILSLQYNLGSID